MLFSVLSPCIIKKKLLSLGYPQLSIVITCLKKNVPLSCLFWEFDYRNNEILIDTLSNRVYVFYMTREFVYMPTFEKQWSSAKLSEDHLKELEVYLCENPEAGDIIQGTGGLRKLRWAVPGRGKRGSIRTLYVDFAYFEQLYMIGCFKKNEKENLSKAEKKQIKSIIEQIKINLRAQGDKNGK